MSSFSKRLTYLINERGILKKDLAKATGTSAATITRYAKNDRDPDVLVLVPRLAKALGTSTDYLLGLSDTMEPSTLGPDEQILINCFRRASGDDIDTLWALMRKYMTDNEKEYIQQLDRQLQAV